MHTKWNDIKKGFIKSMVALTGLSLLTSITMLALPLYTLQIFDRVLTSSSKETLLMLAVALTIIGFTYIVLDHLRRKIPINLAEYIESSLYDGLLLTKKQKNKPTNTEQLSNLKHFLLSPVLIASIDTLWSPLFIISLYLIHPILGSLLLVINLIQALTIFSQLQYMGKLSNNTTQLRTKCDSDAYSFLSHNQINQSMGIMENWLHQSRTQRYKLSKAEHKLHATHNLFSSISLTTRWLTQAILPTIGALLIIDQAITPGELLATLIIGYRAIIPLETLANGWKGIHQFWNNLTDLKQIIINTAPTPKAPPLYLKGDLYVRRLNVKHNSTNTSLLNNINFSAKPGEVLAIIGPNGAGKSLLLETILGMHAPAKGQILLDQSPPANLNPEWMGEQLGYVSQNLSVPSTSVKSFISRQQTKDWKKLIEVTQSTGIHRIIMSLPDGYETELNKRHVSMLNAGLIQRLLIARAFYNDPKYLILDEADAFLDQEGWENYVSNIKQAKESGKTIILVTQRQSTLATADRILMLDHGEQIFLGNQQQLSKFLATQKADSQLHVKTTTYPPLTTVHSDSSRR